MDMREPLRKLKNKNIRFNWTKECKDSFAEFKRLLTTQTVMANFETGRRTRLYMDHGTTGVVSIVAQEHKIPESTEKVWRPVFYTKRAMPLTEQGYSKVEGESLSVLTLIRTNKRYLYGTQFEVVVDHQLLVSL